MKKVVARIFHHNNRDVFLVAGSVVAAGFSGFLLGSLFPAFAYGMNDNGSPNTNEGSIPHETSENETEGCTDIIADLPEMFETPVLLASEPSSTIGSGSVNASPEDPEPEPEPIIEDWQVILPAPCSVTDEMSFSAAFATARQELGAGQVFVWRDKLYNTFYGSEWEALGEDGQMAFGQSIDYQAFEEYKDTLYVEEHEVEVPDDAFSDIPDAVLDEVDIPNVEFPEDIAEFPDVPVLGTLPIDVPDNPDLLFVPDLDVTNDDVEQLGLNSDFSNDENIADLT